MKDFIRELAEQEDWTLRSSAVSATLQSLENTRINAEIQRKSRKQPAGPLNPRGDMNAEIRRSAGSQSHLSGSGKRWRST